MCRISTNAPAVCTIAMQMLGVPMNQLEVTPAHAMQDILEMAGTVPKWKSVSLSHVRMEEHAQSQK